MTDLPPRIAAGHRANRGGFTLIEICTVVVIIAILATIALPSLGTRSDLDTSAAARVLVSDLLFAQSQAIATGQKQYVSFTLASNQPGGGSGSYNLSCPEGTLLTNPTTRQPYTQVMGTSAANGLANVQLSELSFDNASNSLLVFDSLGEPMACPVNGTPVPLAATGTIVLQSNGSTVTLSIEPDTGNITVSP
jgi:prepilin-type N-terminal cleavage/methylation domain-containing protein